MTTTMPNCKQVSRAVAADAFETANWRRRLAIRLHLLMCGHCRRFSRQIRALGVAARRPSGEEPTDTDALDRLRESILGPLQDSSDDG